MITFKTTKEVIVNPMTLDTAFVYLDINEVRFNQHGYVANANYYYLDNGGRIQLKETYPSFNQDEADYIETFTKFDLGDKFSMKFRKLITAAAFYHLDKGGYFGLSSKDWNVYEIEKIDDYI